MLFLAESRSVWLVVVWRVRVVGRRITLSRRVREGRTSWTTAPYFVGRVTVRPSEEDLTQLKNKDRGKIMTRQPRKKKVDEEVKID